MVCGWFAALVPGCLAAIERPVIIKSNQELLLNAWQVVHDLKSL